MPSIRSSTTSELLSFGDRLRVGRAEGNDLRINLGTVSSDHAIVERREGGLYVRDLGSTNGTRVKGRKVLGWTRIQAGDVVRFGPDAAWEVVTVGEDGGAEAPGPSVEVVASGRTFPIGEDRFVIGSAATADLRIESLDPVAAVVVMEDGARWLTTLDGDGEGPGQPLSPSDTFAVGGVELRFVDESVSAMAATVPERTRSRSYDVALTLVHDRPGEGRIVLAAGDDEVTFEGVPNRFVLLLVLARALHGQYPRGCDGDDGWVDDEPIRVALWGRAGSANRFNSALTKVIYDTRKMIAARGLDPFFIEKSRGRTRLRLAADRVSIEGE